MKKLLCVLSLMTAVSLVSVSYAKPPDVKQHPTIHVVNTVDAVVPIVIVPVVMLEDQPLLVPEPAIQAFETPAIEIAGCLQHRAPDVIDKRSECNNVKEKSRSSASPNDGLYSLNEKAVFRWC